MSKIEMCLDAKIQFKILCASTLIKVSLADKQAAVKDPFSLWSLKSGKWKMSGKMWTRIRNEKCGIDPDATSISVFFELGILKLNFSKVSKVPLIFLLRYSPLTCLNYCFWARQNFPPWHASSSFPFLKSINRRWEELLFWKQRMLLFSAYLYMAADGEEATLKKEE